MLAGETVRQVGGSSFASWSVEVDRSRWQLALDLTAGDAAEGSGPSLLQVVGHQGRFLVGGQASVQAPGVRVVDAPFNMVLEFESALSLDNAAGWVDWLPGDEASGGLFTLPLHTRLKDLQLLDVHLDIGVGLADALADELLPFLQGWAMEQLRGLW